MERHSLARARRASSRSDRFQRLSTGPVAVGTPLLHPLLHLQRSIGNRAVQRLIRGPDAHAPHVVQQAPRLQRQPERDPEAEKEREEANKQKVEACLKQKTELLPKVGVVEHINRDVGLDEILGKERQNFEAEIRNDYKAREFVCEAGVGAMMALFYNRDYKNRLSVERARASFSQHPEFYSLAGFDQVKNTKELLKTKFGITTEPGDKEWSPEDVGLLAEALGRLTSQEMPIIRGYRFVRWTNRCNQRKAENADYPCVLKDYQTCGLHEAEIASRTKNITMYDCMKTDPEEFAKLGYEGQPGAETIIHEIGHAMERGRLMVALEKQVDAKRKYERLKKQADAATTADAKASLNKQVTDAKKALDDAEKAVDKITPGAVLAKFKALTKGKAALTPYSKEGPEEAFAEAFMLFKVAPKKLQKANKGLFKWFSEGGFL